MESRYEPDAAARTVEELARRAPDLLALRTYTARLLGGNPSLVLHGGGNTSVKGTAKTALGETDEVIYMKRSGADLATIQPEDHLPVRLEPLRRLRSLKTLAES